MFFYKVAHIHTRTINKYHVVRQACRKKTTQRTDFQLKLCGIRGAVSSSIAWAEPQHTRKLKVNVWILLLPCLIEYIVCSRPCAMSCMMSADEEDTHVEGLLRSQCWPCTHPTSIRSKYDWVLICKNEGHTEYLHQLSYPASHVLYSDFHNDCLFLAQKKTILIPNAENKDRSNVLWLRNLNLSCFYGGKKRQSLWKSEYLSKLPYQNPILCPKKYALVSRCLQGKLQSSLLEEEVVKLHYPKVWCGASTSQG